jgi:hypothetical protein
LLAPIRVKIAPCATVPKPSKLAEQVAVAGEVDHCLTIGLVGREHLGLVAGVAGEQGRADG